MAQPKISIVTPSYNHGPFLEQTIRSVVDQDYANIEYIVIDGGSTDNSVDIIRKYESRLAYWVSEKDDGHRYALKKGFARATGEIVAWQNADDYYAPNVFRRVVDIFNSDPRVDIVYGNVQFVDEHGQPCGELRYVPTTHWSMLFEGFTMNNQAAFFRRRLWDDMGGITFDDHFFDYDLFVRATKWARKMRFVHATLGYYRAHAGSGNFGGFLEHLRTDPWVVRRRYMKKPWATMPAWIFQPVTAASLLRRTLWYMRLGDWDYVGRGIRRRLLGGSGNAPDPLGRRS